MGFDEAFWHRVLTFKRRTTLIGLMGIIKGHHFTLYYSQDEASPLLIDPTRGVLHYFTAVGREQ